MLLIKLPDIAGVITPSPIIMQVPNRTKINSPFWNLGFFSKNSFKREDCHVSAESSVE